MITRRQEAQPSSRDRLIDSALSLLQRQGYSGTGVNQIAADGGAPMGSFYHHFPGGKAELAAAAIRRGADDYRGLLVQAMASADDLGECLARVASNIAGRLEASRWERGCPAATTALETACADGPLRVVAGETFTSWMAVVSERAQAGGRSPERADALASNALALIEGAELLARTQRSSQPLHHAADGLRTLAAAGQ